MSTPGDLYETPQIVRIPESQSRTIFPPPSLWRSDLATCFSSRCCDTVLEDIISWALPATLGGKSGNPSTLIPSPWVLSALCNASSEAYTTVLFCGCLLQGLLPQCVLCRQRNPTDDFQLAATSPCQCLPRPKVQRFHAALLRAGYLH